jgi:hypothetical protein
MAPMKVTGQCHENQFQLRESPGGSQDHTDQEEAYCYGCWVGAQSDPCTTTISDL